MAHVVNASGLLRLQKHVALSASCYTVVCRSQLEVRREVILLPVPEKKAELVDVSDMCIGWL
jgi:hypothetical protein